MADDEQQSAADIARAAWAKEERVQVDPRAARERAAEREREKRQRHAAETLTASPLSRWFPDVEWAIMAYGKPGTSSQYQGDGYEVYVSPNPGREFTLWLDRRDAAPVIDVQYVRWVDASPDGGYTEGYWRGVQVTGPADIGRELAADDNEDAQRAARGEPKRRRT